ncbi:dihydrolipoyl dehydrogenase [Methyloceanibacter sp.]|uniref:dihydrolipoyl dehydrogenase n=1 Tax=Methyloceanibacter sp. TaxID=1965321 RepID=UPI002D46C485|nr:dihydrolipoyl dehydrogenase [Methyloceanibacter sp.]HZP09987.1 dihydrolipoyl dehydrogenase [Methyloceanibacter sp.]
MSETQADLAVIGAGPGGYVAAIRAAQLGLKTAIIEREQLGGICLNWGCIPTKALLRTSELYHAMRRAGEFGLACDNVRFDIAKVVERSRKVAERLSNGVAYLMRKNKIEVIKGVGRLAGEGRIAVTGVSGEALPGIAAKHIIVATGARARTLPGLEPDGKLVWTYKEAMVPPSFPKSLLIVGSGAIGIEFASFYRSLGAEVTVVELLPRILPAEDAEISELARKAFARQGIVIHTETQVTNIFKGADSVAAAMKKSDGRTEEIAVERVILAIGITGNVEGIGLEEQGVKVEKGHIVVDEWCRTGIPGLYAIGDVVGPPWLAHKASHEGIVCVEKIAGIDGVHPIGASNIPGCTYSSPQIASVGLTEEKARDGGREVRVGRFPYSANGKAIALGETEGLVKTIFDERSGALLGAHIIGAEATELIQGFAIARTLETTEAELMATIFPHPTLSEMMGESVLDAYGRALHI